MPIHKVKLTDQGFKTFAKDIWIDVLSIIFTFAILIIFSFKFSGSLLYFLFYYFFISLIFFYFRFKNGYIYPLSFFYQANIFLIITPLVYLNWITLSILLITMGALFYKINPFRNLYFPLGLFQSLIVTMIGLLTEKSDIFNSLMNPGSITSEYNLTNNVSGLHFYFFENPVGAIDYRNYSIIENFGLFILPFISFFFLRKYNLLNNILMSVGIFYLFQNYYSGKSDILLSKILNASCLWFLIYSAPGRNYGFSHVYSFISLVFTIGFSTLFLNGSNELPSFYIVIIFFVIQSSFYVLINDKRIIKSGTYRRYLKI